MKLHICKKYMDKEGSHDSVFYIIEYYDDYYLDKMYHQHSFIHQIIVQKAFMPN